jgi:hypothetical protein
VQGPPHKHAGAEQDQGQPTPRHRDLEGASVLRVLRGPPGLRETDERRAVPTVVAFSGEDGATAQTWLHPAGWFGAALACFSQGERQIPGSKLPERTTEPQPRYPDRRFRPAREHQVEVRRCPLHEQFERRDRCWPLQDMHVVEHQPERFPHDRHVPHQPVDEARIHLIRGRDELVERRPGREPPGRAKGLQQPGIPGAT